MYNLLMCGEREIALLAEYCKEHLPLADAVLGDEYYYGSLSFCVIDAVFSIGVRYTSTRNTINSYASYFGLELFREDRNVLPTIENQQSISQLLQSYENHTYQEMAEGIFHNRQRTSSINGILKAEAVKLFAETLITHGINYFQEMHNAHDNADFENEIRSIPGQNSGISLRYFLMLSGDDNLIKPDRWIIRFVSKALARMVEENEAVVCLQGVSAMLSADLPHMTPRLLDNIIWQNRNII